MLCRLCLGVVREEKIKPSSSDTAFASSKCIDKLAAFATYKLALPIIMINDIQILQLTKGLCNWKDSTTSFRCQEMSQRHKEAIEKML